MSAEWKRERLYFDGDGYFASLLGAIARACRSIELESYIFELDEVGTQVLEALRRAAARGVRVRLLVDGFGSLHTAGAIRRSLRGSRVRFHVYHPVRVPSAARFGRWYARLNRRNHRKTCIVDGRRAWTGSINVSGVHCRGSGNPPWRDTGVCVEGAGVRSLRRAFDLAWRTRGTHAAWPIYRLVRLNFDRATRRANYDEYLARIARARRRVWLTTPYFVPSHRLLRSLIAAGRRGVDVRLLFPGRSDIPGMAAVAASFFEVLLPAGVRVFLYRPAILHAKVSLIDGWATVGSSNLNYRSLLHDLEGDLVLTQSSSVRALERSFRRDLTRAARVSVSGLGLASRARLAAGRVGQRLRYWL